MAIDGSCVRPDTAANEQAFNAAISMARGAYPQVFILECGSQRTIQMNAPLPAQREVHGRMSFAPPRRYAGDP